MINNGLKLSPLLSFQAREERSMSIIERNKKLARYGMGVLSLTEEEQKRVKAILRQKNIHPGYNLIEKIEKLKEIDCKLEEIKSHQKTPLNQPKLLEKKRRNGMDRLRKIDSLLEELRVEKVSPGADVSIKGFSIDVKIDSDTKEDVKEERASTPCLTSNEKEINNV